MHHDGTLNDRERFHRLEKKCFINGRSGTDDACSSDISRRLELFRFLERIEKQISSLTEQLHDVLSRFLQTDRKSFEEAVQGQRENENDRSERFMRAWVTVHRNCCHPVLLIRVFDRVLNRTIGVGALQIKEITFLLVFHDSPLASDEGSSEARVSRNQVSKKRK